MTPDVWQTTTFDDDSMVWQTNDDGDFCLITDPCELGEFKDEYPDANLFTLTVGDRDRRAPGHDVL